MRVSSHHSGPMSLLATVIRAIYSFYHQFGARMFGCEILWASENEGARLSRHDATHRSTPHHKRRQCRTDAVRCHLGQKQRMSRGIFAEVRGFRRSEECGYRKSSEIWDRGVEWNEWAVTLWLIRYVTNRVHDRPSFQSCQNAREEIKMNEWE